MLGNMRLSELLLKTEFFGVSNIFFYYIDIINFLSLMCQNKFGNEISTLNKARIYKIY